MKSKVTPEFRKLLRALPDDIRKQARAAYRLFRLDPYHPSLQFKRIGQRNNLYSVRIGLKYRALGLRVDDLIIWDWIGSHGEYDKRL
jgi:mRNA-degrading endonuclease RelE of RelBE toxin-antitoxin system